MEGDEDRAIDIMDDDINGDAVVVANDRMTGLHDMVDVGSAIARVKRRILICFDCQQFTDKPSLNQVIPDITPVLQFIY
jgi:hypothetical protein